MKVKHPGDDDTPLHAVLKAGTVMSPLPQNFQDQVWRRIQRAETRPGAVNSFAVVITHWIATVLPRPALATCYLAVLLAAGATVGWAQSQEKTARVFDELSRRYVRSIDPYQTFR